MKSRVRSGCITLLAAATLTGCGDFFPAKTATLGGSTSGNYVYVANQQTNTVSGFAVGTNALTLVSGSPYPLTTGLAPNAVVVSRDNSLVYVGGVNAIEAFSIGSTGGLTMINGGGTAVTGTVASMATSPDKQWLIALVQSATSAGVSVNVYGINTATGVLTQQQAAALSFQGVTIGAVTPKVVRISPAGNYIAAAVGTAGDALFGFTTATGTLTSVAYVAPVNPAMNVFLSDNAINFDSTSAFLFVGTSGQTTGTSSISSFPITALGGLNAGTPYGSGDSPASIELDSTGKLLYSANRASGNISGYTVNGGVLAPIAGSPFSASSQVNSLVRDKSGSYLVATAGSSTQAVTSDVTLYGFDAFAPQKINAVVTAASGTDPANAVSVAATH